MICSAFVPERLSNLAYRAETHEHIAQTRRPRRLLRQQLVAAVLAECDALLSDDLHHAAALALRPWRARRGIEGLDGAQHIFQRQGQQ